MRKPRDLHNYVPAKEAAAFLRREAKIVEAGPEYELVKIRLSIWGYIDEPVVEDVYPTEAKDG